MSVSGTDGVVVGAAASVPRASRGSAAVARGTIELGIPLGATNSRIAVSRAGTVTLIPNVDGAECTPTAVWLDEEEQIVVGARALSRLGSDPGNVLTGFVKLLGSGEMPRFTRSARAAEPTDLVAPSSARCAPTPAVSWAATSRTP